MTCIVCSATYPVSRGMPLLYVDDERWAPKARESEGWVTLHKEMGIYEHGEDAVDLKIPYYPEEPWTKVAVSFDMALDRLQLAGDEVVLDLGAGRGWAAKHFAVRGCRVVATDVTDDDNVGLGRGHALMQEAGVHFDRVIADGERLPFHGARFDLVFCAAALHHTSNLPLFMQQIARVLRPGGLLCAINEPVISVTLQEKAALVDAEDELRHGINETRPDLLDYEAALAQAGLTVAELTSPRFETWSEEQIRKFAEEKGVEWSWPRLSALRPSVYRLVRWIRLRVGAMIQGRRPPYLQSSDERARLSRALLLWQGDELFLLARRPERN